jgi:acyl carrier protein
MLEAPAVEARFLELVRELLTELGREQAIEKLSLNASFERDLGMASLDLVELLVRCEIRFEVRLPDAIAEEAETPEGWVRAILEGGVEHGETEAYHIGAPPAEAPPEPRAAATLVEVLRMHAEAAPGRVHAHILDGDEGESVTYGGLLAGASKVAAGLASFGLRRGDAVAIMLPTGADFLEGFLGVLLGGCTAVPIYPPSNPDTIEDYVRRQIRILKHAGIRFLITFDRVRAISQIIRFHLPEIQGVSTAAGLREAGTGGWGGPPEPAAIAVIQYTSGSTGDPKGVVLTHANLLANIRAIGGAVGVKPSDAVVSWLPLCSDMGLIATWLFSLYYAAPITLLSPLEFINRPERWLWAIHNSRGTLSAAPNFAYELCARKVPAWTLEGLDLSSWRGAVNAGEAVMPDTVSRFARRFQPFGFREEALLACYGLAESSVALTFPEIGRKPRLDTILRAPFERGGRAEPAGGDGAGENGHLRFYSVGKPLAGHEVRVADESGAALPERMEGRLQFRGPSMTPGYYRNPGASAAAVTPDGWMDSGDLGYLSGGDVFFTRRRKDTIVKAGRSISAEDVESAVHGVPGVEPGGAAAFGVVDAATGTEDLVVVCETRASLRRDLDRIELSVQRSVEEVLGIPADRVELVPPGALPRTSNGKLRRSELRSGRRAPSRPPWLQIALLWRDSLRPLAGFGVARSVRGLRRAMVFGFAAGAAGILRVGGESAARPLARGLLSLDGTGFTLEGAEIPARPSLFVANRRAQADPLLLAAALPGSVRFAEVSFPLEPLTVGEIGGESAPPGGTLRSRVERELASGRSVIAIGDGRARYRIDPFQAALSARAPVVPVAMIDGADGKVRLVVGKCILPAPDTGAAALRHEARAALEELCR